MSSSGRERTRRLPLSSVLLSSLRGYQRRWLAADAFAFVTLFAIAVPEQLATSRLAGMPPITGFYAFIAGSVMFALLGSNPQMSVGADSTIAPLFAIGIAHFASTGSPYYIDLVGILAVTTGIIVALVGLLRLGWISEFLSAPIITGFLAGVAVIIVVHQLPDLFGIPAASGSTLHRIASIFDHLGQTNGWALGIGLGGLLIVVGADRIDRRLPGTLVALVGATALVAALGLQAHGVEVLGTFSHGAPRFGLEGLSFSALRKVLPIAVVVALVIISQSAATTRAFADQGDYDVDVGRDFVGVGAGSILAGLIGSFPVNASPARTAAVASSGGRTQAAMLGAAAAMVLLVPAAGVLKDVPLAILAAVLLFIASRIFHTRELIAIGRYDYFELALATITLLTVALIGVEQGIGVAVGLAILDRTRLTSRPQLHVLGRIPGTTSWVQLTKKGNETQVPGVLVLLFSTPLWYANAIRFRSQVGAVVRRSGHDVQVLVLEAAGMTDIDYTGSQAMSDLLDEFDRRHITFGIARAGGNVRASLARSGLLQRIGEDHFFASTDEAVIALCAESDKGDTGSTGETGETGKPG
jgi:sulfate permease, SulP family